MIIIISNILKNIYQIMEILSQKRQANEMADGMRPDLFYSFIRELAAGCYRSEK
jgi:hypothetical protein